MPTPNKIPPSAVCTPMGRTFAEGGSNPMVVTGTCRAMTIPKPTDATARPSSTPFMVRPWPSRKRSRKADAKQNRPRCSTNPNARPNTQNMEYCGSDPRARRKMTAASPHAEIARHAFGDGPLTSGVSA